MSKPRFREARGDDGELTQVVFVVGNGSEETRDAAEQTANTAALGFVAAWRFSEVAATPKLGMGVARCGQLVFKAWGTLGYTARRQGVGGADSEAAAVVIEAETSRGRKTVPLMRRAGC